VAADAAHYAASAMPPAGPILMATSNTHKLAEVRAVFEPAGVGLEGLDRLGRSIAEPVEDQPTFAGNAELKARYYAQRTGRWCLADDSGLIVDALNGEPGVRSARYAGASGTRAQIDAANNARLLRELAGVPELLRTARFVCVMALCEPGRTLTVVQGEVAGRILLEPRGDNGFGYDPLFFVPELGLTAAQMPPRQKNAISHRGRAARKLLEALRALGEPA